MSIYLIILLNILSSLNHSTADRLLQEKQQIIIVLTSDINDSKGYLLAYERVDFKTSWKKINHDTPITIGAKGFAYADSLLPLQWITMTDSDLKKHEGDQRTPMGIFKLDFIFGRITKTNFISSLKMPYRATRPFTYCVDDSQSPQYNQWVQQVGNQSSSWQSAEDLFQVDVYDLAINVAYNTNQKPQAGSCIFIHRWHFKFEPTLGCTALDTKDLQNLVQWLDIKKNPLLIQLTMKHYQALRARLNLPIINLDIGAQ